MCAGTNRDRAGPSPAASLVYHPRNDGFPAESFTPPNHSGTISHGRRPTPNLRCLALAWLRAVGDALGMGVLSGRAATSVSPRVQPGPTRAGETGASCISTLVTWLKTALGWLRWQRSQRCWSPTAVLALTAETVGPARRVLCGEVVQGVLSHVDRPYPDTGHPETQLSID
jgi:hypothetical protein